jgi:hypothetical protein
VTCALRFFYAVTLGRKEAIERIISAREPVKQPLVLSAEEVARFLEAVPALRDRVALVLDDTQKTKANDILPGLAFGPGPMGGPFAADQTHKH